MQIANRTSNFQVPTLAQPTLPTPEPQPAPAERSFASLMQRTQPVCHAPQPSDKDTSDADAEPAPEAKTPARPRLAPRAAPKPAGKPVAQPAVPDEAEAAQARAAGAADKAANDPATATPGPGALPQPMPLLPADAGGRVSLPASASGADGAGGPQTLPAPAGTPGGPVRGQPGDMPQALTGLAALPSGDALPAAAAVAAETERPAGPQGTSAAAAPAPFATLLASAGAPAHAAEAAPAPTPTTLATPTTAPEFAQALGVQVSVFARDGVQHAELHLNPAETGPVSVQIVLDGTQAHVEFGADLAATRQAIEAGLPELAAALRDAGFTLSGGGVSQHARGESGSDEASRRPGAASRRSGEPQAVPALAQPLRTRVAAGGVDLYA